MGFIRKLHVQIKFSARGISCAPTASRAGPSSSMGKSAPQKKPSGKGEVKPTHRFVPTRSCGKSSEIVPKTSFTLKKVFAEQIKFKQKTRRHAPRQIV